MWCIYIHVCKTLTHIKIKERLFKIRGRQFTKGQQERDRKGGDGDRRDRKGGDRDRRDRRWGRWGQKRVGYTPQGPRTVCKQGSPGRGWQMKCSHTPT